MENATKALLIAAAVLVAILIISLGLVVYNMAAETVNSQNLSQQEVQAQNEKFARYDGTNKRGSEVNAMLKTVLQSNMDLSATNKSVGLVNVTSEGNAGISLTTGAISITKRADTSKMYDIIVKYDSKSGLVNEITVKIHTNTDTNTNP